MLSSSYVHVRFTKVPFIVTVTTKPDNYFLLRHILPEHVNSRDLDDLVFALRRIYPNCNVCAVPYVPF